MCRNKSDRWWRAGSRSVSTTMTAVTILFTQMLGALADHVSEDYSRYHHGIVTYTMRFTTPRYGTVLLRAPHRAGLAHGTWLVLTGYDDLESNTRDVLCKFDFYNGMLVDQFVEWGRHFAMNVGKEQQPVGMVWYHNSDCIQSWKKGRPSTPWQVVSQPFDRPLDSRRMCLMSSSDCTQAVTLHRAPEFMQVASLSRVLFTEE